MMCSKMKFTASNTLGRERKFLDSTNTCGSPGWAVSGRAKVSNLCRKMPGAASRNR